MIGTKTFTWFQSLSDAEKVYLVCFRHLYNLEGLCISGEWQGDLSDVLNFHYLFDSSGGRYVFVFVNVLRCFKCRVVLSPKPKMDPVSIWAEFNAREHI